MKLILFFLLLISSSLQIDESKALIIYFSRAGENYSVGTVDKGNTEIIVDYLTKVTKIKSFKINPETEYPTSYSETLEIATKEKNSNSRPNIKNPLTSISDYDVILLGYPIWHSNLPNIVMNQLELLDFEGKTIYPFNTHEGSGTGNSINDIKNSAPKADVKDGFPLKGQYARTNASREDINEWLNNVLQLDIDVPSDATDETDATDATDATDETDENIEVISNNNNNSNNNKSYIKGFSVLLLLSCIFIF